MAICNKRATGGPTQHGIALEFYLRPQVGSVCLSGLDFEKLAIGLVNLIDCVNLHRANWRINNHQTCPQPLPPYLLLTRLRNRDIRFIGAICCDPRSGIDKYSPTNKKKKRVKNTRWRSHSVFHEVFS